MFLEHRVATIEPDHVHRLIPAVNTTAASRQQAITRFLTRHHRPITVASGFLLLAVAFIGWQVDIRPN